MGNAPTKYDLEERTREFGIKIIRLCKSTPRSIITDPIIKQLIRSGTSVGANYLEANGASSKKDFCNKIYICKKESQETKHWLIMLSESTESEANIKELLDEVQQLSMIFHKIVSTIRNKELKN